ncbi:MAG TPA: R2-like ligand-binding oxidase [Gaiellaceae bacterium]
MARSVPLREGFRSTGGGLRDSFPLRLYDKAKRLGVWDPSDLDFRRDREQWLELPDDERGALTQIASLFLAGEEGVTLDLLPLVLTIAREGRLEEELYLTTFLFEEGKHTQLFARFIDEVAGAPTDLERWHTPSYRTIFYDELPRSMNALLEDPSPAAQARAAVTYNMVVEGVLAETGYQVYHDALVERDLLPGLRQGLGYVKRDEARHIAYGVYLLSRLVAADAALWAVVAARMEELLPLALGFVQETYEPWGDVSPFGVERDTVLAWATTQFQKRFERIERARGKTLAEIDALAEEDSVASVA